MSPSPQEPTPDAEVRLAVDALTGVATLTLSHPRRRNAITLAMAGQLIRYVTELAAVPEIRLLVLGGADGDFSSGADITALRPDGPGELGEELMRCEDVLRGCPLPTIAAVEGNCVGAALQLALACDLRVAASDARFGITPARLGLVYPAPTVARLVRSLGAAAAKRLLFTGDLLGAEAAARLGVVDEVAAPDAFPATVDRLAGTIAARSAVSVAAAKDMVDASAEAPDGEVPRSVSTRWAEVGNPDLAVGLAAFAAGRPPVFPPRHVGL
ncbi:enoyl-CoA hydratase/isomerase family protein [Streptomyces sp. NBC_01298]|uniref:enoyl-CoA hydratase/isomerase family protein n=1 Tax=Streptomyces sp. NBC_01298 TaxID=2903817 RepID=UPI002E127FEB|nr:enoyl-CoA hydratase/isomerase family protein [Streptomyces sp. NBC_01298]